VVGESSEEKHAVSSSSSQVIGWRRGCKSRVRAAGAVRVAVASPSTRSLSSHVPDLGLGRAGGDGMEGLAARLWNFWKVGEKRGVWLGLASLFLVEKRGVAMFSLTPLGRRKESAYSYTLLVMC